MTVYVISTSFRPLSPSLVGKYIAFGDSLTCSPPYSYIILPHSRFCCLEYFLANEMTTYGTILLEEQRCFYALTFRGINMLLDHITVGPFKNSSLTSSQNISWNCVLFSYFPRNFYLSFLSSFFFSCSSLLRFAFANYTIFFSDNVHPYYHYDF